MSRAVIEPPEDLGEQGATSPILSDARQRSGFLVEIVGIGDWDKHRMQHGLTACLPARRCHQGGCGHNVRPFRIGYSVLAADSVRGDECLTLAEGEELEDSVPDLHHAAVQVEIDVGHRDEVANPCAGREQRDLGTRLIKAQPQRREAPVENVPASLPVEGLEAQPRSPRRH